MGAGASKPFNIPDMNELSDLIIKKYEKQYDEKTAIKDIQRRIEKYGLKHDIEAILSCIDALNDSKNWIKNSGAFAAYISRFSTVDQAYYGKKEGFYKKMSKDIRNFIRELCFLPDGEENNSKISKVYDNFFKSIKFEYLHGLSVFTTNYDYCFETYCMERSWDFFDGFEPKWGIQTYVGFDKTDKKLQIYKLHGSSNYVVTGKKSLVKTDSIVRPGNRIASGIIAKESMIFPTSEKSFSKKPYFELLFNLRKELASGIRQRQDRIIIIVGYSFRDKAINNAFIDAMETPVSKSKLIYLVDPIADTIIKDNIPELDGTIKPINKKFENVYSQDFLDTFK